MQTFQPIRIEDLSGGMNTKVIPHLTQKSEVKLALNCILDEFGCLKKRLGYTQVGDQITASADIIGLYYSKEVGKHLAVADDDGATPTNSDIYYNNSGTWTKAEEDWTAGVRTRFTDFVGYVFAFNGTDSTKSSSDGTSWGTTNLTDAPTCKYGIPFQQRLYMAGDSTYPDRVYYSSVPSATQTISWDTSNDYFDVNPDDGDNITGFEKNSRHLLIFKHNGMYRWNGYSLESDRIIAVGSSSQESIKTQDNVTYFANRYGVYKYDGGYPTCISRKIQDWIDAIPAANLSTLTAETDQDHYYLSVGDVTVDSVDYTNVVLVYNIPLKAWTVWSLSDEPKWIAKYESSSAEYIGFGDDNGEIFRLNNGNGDDTTTPIEVQIETNPYDLGRPEEEKKFSEVYFVTEKAKGGTSASYKINNETTPQELGIIKDDVGKIPSTAEGRKIALMLSEKGTGESWKLTHILFREVISKGVLPNA